MISLERASEEEQNGANFSFIAPSSEELCVSILVTHSNVNTCEEETNLNSVTPSSEEVRVQT